jgi:transposase-like protein
VLVCERRDAAAARAFFIRAMTFGAAPVEVTTDRAPVYPRVIDEVVPAARHLLERHANNVIEADHARLKARLRPMRGLKRIRSARTLALGHAFVQNLRRGHYELAAEEPACDRVRVAFGVLARCL